MRYDLHLKLSRKSFEISLKFYTSQLMDYLKFEKLLPVKQLLKSILNKLQLSMFSFILLLVKSFRICYQTFNRCLFNSTVDRQHEIVPKISCINIFQCSYDVVEVLLHIHLDSWFQKLVYTFRLFRLNNFNASKQPLN